MLAASAPKQALKSMGDSFTSSSFLPILLMTGSETILENRAVEMGPSSLPAHQGISPLFLRRRESAGPRDGLEGVDSYVLFFFRDRRLLFQKTARSDCSRPRKQRSDSNGSTRLLKRFITAEVRRISLQRVAEGVNTSGDGSSGGKVGHKRQVIEKVTLRGKLEGEQPRALLNVDGYDNCSKS